MENTCSSQDSRPGVPDVFGFVKENHDNPKKNAVRDFYDTIPSSYDKFTREVLYTGPDKVFAILSKYCPNKTVSILECGAGTGVIGEKLSALGYKDLIAVDFSQKSLDVAEKKCVYKKLICADIVAQRMPFSDSEFDVLICSGCIIPGHITPKCFSEWTRIVKPGGYVVIILRRCYVELEKNLDVFYSQSLAESFNAEISSLEISKRWEVVLRQTFPGYVYNDGILNDGIEVVCKVL